MKSLDKFFKTAFFGAIVVLIPFLIILVILKKAFGALNRMAEPLATKMGLDVGSGQLLMTIAIILLLVLICFVAGMIVRSTRANFQIPFANRMAAMMIPGFEVIKAQSHEGMKQKTGDGWQSVFLKMEKGWTLAFIVEKTNEGMCSIFIPEIPKMDSGELMIMDESEMEAIHIESREVFGYLRAFGKGASARFVAERNKK